MPRGGGFSAKEKHAIFDDEYRNGDSSDPGQETTGEDYSLSKQPKARKNRLTKASPKTELDAKNDARADSKDGPKVAEQELVDLRLDPDWELLRRAKAKEFQKADRILARSPEENPPRRLVKDAAQKSAAHYAAMSSLGAATLFKMISYFGSSCLTERDSEWATPLHYSMGCFSKDSVEKILKYVSAKDLERSAKTGDTVYHFAAVNQNIAGEQDKHESQLTRPPAYEFQLCFFQNKDKTGEKIQGKSQQKQKRINIFDSIRKCKLSCYCFSKKEKESDKEASASQSNSSAHPLPDSLPSDSQAGIASPKLCCFSKKEKESDKEAPASQSNSSASHPSPNSPPSDSQVGIASPKFCCFSKKEKDSDKEAPASQSNSSAHPLPDSLPSDSQAGIASPKLCCFSKKEKESDKEAPASQSNSSASHPLPDSLSSDSQVDEISSETLFGLIYKKITKELGAGSSKTFLSLANLNKQTVLHLAAMYSSIDELKTLLKISEGSEQYLSIRDEEGSYFYHYAALNKRFSFLLADKKQHEKILATLEQRLPPDSMTGFRHEFPGKFLPFSLENYHQQNFLHCAIISEVFTDKTTVRIINYFQKKKSYLPKDFIQKEDRFGNTALILSFKHRKIKTAKLLLKLTDCQHWKKPNKEGKSAAHYASLDFNSKKQLYELTTEESELEELISDQSFTDKEGRSCLFYACMGWNVDAFEPAKILKRSSHVNFRTDSDGNTLLHALFLNTDKRSGDEIIGCLDLFSKIMKAGVDPTQENILGQNCLHASILNQDVLKMILERINLESSAPKYKELRLVFKKLLIASNGFHAVHAFAGKYQLEELAEPLAKLAECPPETLLKLRVARGPFKGATCLHFACETFHHANIQYLRNETNRLDLWAETHSGLTPIDFSKTLSKFELVGRIEATRDEGEHMRNQLRRLSLIDPAYRGVKVPSISEASEQIAAILDYLSVQMSAKESKVRTNYKIGKWLLFWALNIDSVIIYKSAIRLRWITYETESEFYLFLLENEKELERSRLNTKLDVAAAPDEPAARQDSGEYDRLTNRNRDWKQYKMLEPFRCSSEMLVVDIALYLHKLEILPELLLTRQFELLPVCLSLLLHLRIEISENKNNDPVRMQLKELRSKVLFVTVNAFEGLYSVSKSEEDESVIMDYLNGRIPAGNQKAEESDSSKAKSTRKPCGPKFPCRYTKGQKKMYDQQCGRIKYYTVFKMVELLDSEDIFSTNIMQQLVEKKWHELEDPYRQYFPPKLKYSIHFLAFAIFLIFFAWYIIDFRRTFQSAVPEVVMACYLLSFTVQEAIDIYKGRKMRYFFRNDTILRYPEYFKEQLNLFDCAAILFMWVGLLWKWAIFSTGMEQPTAYACQMVLSSAFLLWGFRSVSFLSYFETIGPVISMMRSLLIKDLLPFAAITLVIFYSSSVFFFNLLFPASTATAAELVSDTYTASVFQQVFTLPFILFLDNPPDYESSANGTDQAVGSVANPTGNTAFKSFFVFAFLLVVNVVMVNLLIALFSLRVSTMVSRARCIWSSKRFYMLQEFKKATIVPPPLSFLQHIITFYDKKIKVKIVRNKVHPYPKKWWLSEDRKAYPQRYLDFLKLQAEYLSTTRPDLMRQLENNQPDFDGLKASTSNSLAQLQRRLENSLEKQDQRLEKLDKLDEGLEKPDNLEDPHAKNLKRLEEKVDALTKVLNSMKSPASPYSQTLGKPQLKRKRKSN